MRRDLRPNSTDAPDRLNLQFAALLKVTPVVMTALMGLVLFANVPSSDVVTAYIPQAVTYAILTGFALYFAVWLSQGTLSPAHIIGMMAFLSLPQDAFPLMVWATFIGAVGGGASLLTQSRQRVGIAWESRINNLLMVAARITISFFIAGQLYVALEGTLPLDTALWRVDNGETFALISYTLIYFLLYTTIFILELYVSALPVGAILRTNAALILTILVLPIPFAIVSAELSGEGLDQPTGIIGVVAMAVIIIGLYAVSRSDHRTRRQLDEMMTISVVTRAMRAHLETSGLLRTIYIQISDLFVVDDFTLLIYENGGPPTHALVIRDGEEQTFSTLADLTDSPLLHHVIGQKESLFLHDRVDERARAHGLTLPDDSAFHAWMGVPLVIDTGGYGVMAVASRRTQRTFTPNDLRLLTIVADSVSIAIENAGLFERQRERVLQLSTLNSIAAMLTGTLSPESVLDMIVSSASTIGESQGVALYLYMDDDGEDVPPPLVRAIGLSDEFNAVAPPPLLADGHPFHDRKPLAIEDIMRDSRAVNVRPVMEAEEMRSLVEVPLVIGERALGVVTMFYRMPQTLGGEGLELLRAFATQAAQAITNARAYTTTDEAFQRSVEQLLSLAGIGRLLTSTIDLQQICNLVLQHVMDATHAHAGLVLLVEHESGDRLLTYNVISPETKLEPAAAAGGITQRTLETGQIQRVDDVFRENWFDDNARLTETSRAQLAAPILRGREVLGVIVLESERSGGFSSEDSHFVAQIANQAVIAIDNARLFQRITEARDRLQVILDTMEEAILLIDNRGKIALANPRIALLDLRPSQLLDRDINDALDDPELDLLGRMGFGDADDFRQMVSAIGVNDGWKEIAPHLYVVASGDGGRRYVQRFVIPVLDDAAQTIGALLVFYDKTHEQELSRAREELTRMIVHDLRAPLTAVTTGLRILQDYIPETNDAYTLIQTTTQNSRQAVHKLLSRVDSLLDIAKMQSGRLAIERTPVELQSVVDTVLKQLHPLAAELDIRIVHRIPADLPQLHADRDKVERLLLNLVDNALKYSPTRAEIIVEATLPDDDGFVRLNVIDRGPGVPEEYKETLFDAFVQVEGRQGARRGVGLGLSFCKMVAEAHGGSIWVEDNQPTGSAFAVLLPLSGGDDPADTVSAVDAVDTP